ncbi:hypothetical protein VTO42DRAFT_8768 [Malbranchea cinnamomea]
MSPQTDDRASESTPLLAGQEERVFGSSDDRRPIASTPSSPSPEQVPLVSPNKLAIQGRRIRWTTVLALLSLVLAVLAVVFSGFLLPSIVREYAEEAAVVEPLALSLASFTASGVRARVQATIVLDARRVQSQHVRNLGRLGTWVAKELETTEDTELQIYLPEYGNVRLGTATIPPIKVNIRNGHVNLLEFFADLKVGDLDGLKVVGSDWLAGRLGQIRIRGTANVPLKSGVLNLGSQSISKNVVLQGQDLPSFSEFNVTKLNLHDVPIAGNKTAVEADVSISLGNDYPIELAIPSLVFQVLVPNCNPGDPNILVGNATTEELEIKPRQPITVDVTGRLHEFPDELTSMCPGRASSPLDSLVERYIRGLETTIYVSGGDFQEPGAPSWLGNLFSNLIMPIPFTSRGFSHLIKRFSMTNVHIYLPESFAEPGSPEARPKVSSLVKVAVGLPKQMNFPINVSRVRSTADVYYKDDPLGKIDLQKWQHARSARNASAPVSAPELLVEFDVKKAPLEITNEDAFTDIVQTLIFYRKPLKLDVRAKVDAQTETPMGTFAIQDIPANAQITLNPPANVGMSDLKPRIESVMIAQTTRTSVNVVARMNFTNPTAYSAYIPFVDMRLAHNGTDVAHLIARDLSIQPGENSRVEVECLWSPLKESGVDGVIAGRALLSRYVSGLNTTVSLRPFEGTIPSLPTLGRNLSGLELEFAIPRLGRPGDDGSAPDGDHPRFIRDATVHLWSSTAVFTLLSPLRATTIFITSIDATAFYKRDKAVGRIQYKLPFAVPPALSRTPRLPVELDFGGTGYEALKRALGGTLKLDAVADVGVMLGDYEDLLFYQGEAIGVKVRI